MKQEMCINLWFDDQAEEAVQFYTGIFKDSKVGTVSKFNKVGFDIHKRPKGSIMTIEFSLNGMDFLALNGGPYFTFNEAVSIIVYCETQEEIDEYWGKLSQGGDEKAQQCGWLKDKYGLSWQIVPNMMKKLFLDPDSEKSERATEAMLKMKKLDIAALQQAYDGK